MKKIKIAREWSFMMASIRFERLLELAIREGPQLVEDDRGHDIIVMDALEFERRAAEANGRRAKRSRNPDQREAWVRKARSPQRKLR